MASAGGFWSYVREDDIAEGGRITQLGQDLAAQYELLSGQPINLFVDQSSLLWGDDWREKVDEALASIAFFIPVIAPKYFQSPECRRELQRFVARAEVLGFNELILPLVYAPVPALLDAEPVDDIVRLVKRYQWVDWRELGFAERQDGPYRRAVAGLAERLMTAEATISREPLPAIGLSKGSEPDVPDEPAGLIDVVAQAEEALPRWTATMAEITQLIERIGDISQGAGAEITKRDAQGKGFAGRLVVLRQLARDLAEPSDKLVERSSEFTSHLYEVDQGFKALIEHDRRRRVRMSR